ncbi:uncharacterized protein DDB_G0290685-like [Myripristis murdjan]|uniref:uncharacterized protein DDB_G0290685-like n=1 Tax=Myripristis murdjan TaxID=586833 RepID=UPI001175F4F1|nr:uncharacterized protein DDB_G0290685-like [Myripristis murdjan]
MFYLKDKLPLKSQLRLLVLHHALVCLLLTHSCAGQSQVIGPPQPIVATVGDDVVLLSHLEPAVDATGMTVEWARPDLEPRFVHVWRHSQELVSKKHPSYKGRTSLFTDKLKDGDVSLKLSRVNPADEGKYKCFIPSVGIETIVELIVGAASSPVINVSKSSSGVVLECESKGWYPEPELFWLDAEGKLLSAGAPETVRGLDGLYTVSSRVTVEKSHSNSFTCRVQQSKIQQTRETQIHVPDDFFMVTSDSAVRISIILAVVFLCVTAAIFLVWKSRQNENKTKMHDEEEGRETAPLMAGADKKVETERDGKKELLSEAERQRRALKTETTKTNEEDASAGNTATNMEAEKHKQQSNTNLEETEKQGDEEKRLQPGTSEIPEETKNTNLKIQNEGARENEEDSLETEPQTDQQKTEKSLESQEEITSQLEKSNMDVKNKDAEHQEDTQDKVQVVGQTAGTDQTERTDVDKAGQDNAQSLSDNTEDDSHTDVERDQDQHMEEGHVTGQQNQLDNKEELEQQLENNTELQGLMEGERDTEQSVTEREEKTDQDNKKEKPEEEPQKKEDEEKHVGEAAAGPTENKELEKQTEQLNVQPNETEGQTDEKERQPESVDQEKTGSEGDKTDLKDDNERRLQPDSSEILEETEKTNLKILNEGAGKNEELSVETEPQTDQKQEENPLESQEENTEQPEDLDKREAEHQGKLQEKDQDKGEGQDNSKSTDETEANSQTAAGGDGEQHCRLSNVNDAGATQQQPAAQTSGPPPSDNPSSPGEENVDEASAATDDDGGYEDAADENNVGEDTNDGSFKSTSSDISPSNAGQEEENAESRTDGTEAKSQTEAGGDGEQVSDGRTVTRQQIGQDKKKTGLEQPENTQQREESEGTTVMETKMEDSNEKAENKIDSEKTEKQRDEKLQSGSGEERQKETGKTDLKTQQETAGRGKQELQQATGPQVDSSETEAENQENQQDGDQDAEEGTENNETENRDENATSEKSAKKRRKRNRKSKAKTAKSDS